MAQRAEVIIFTISTSLMNNHTKGDENLKALAEATGGRAFFPVKLDDVVAAFADIQDELRSQYMISYRPDQFVVNGQFRPIQIVADNKKFKVRAKRGYFAPKSRRRGSPRKSGSPLAVVLSPCRRRFIGRIVSLARLDLVSVFGFDLKAAEFAVIRRVGGSEAKGVLAAQLSGNLSKSLIQFVRTSHRDHAAAGLLRQFAHVAIVRGIHGIGNQQHVSHNVSLLRRLNGIFQLSLLPTSSPSVSTTMALRPTWRPRISSDAR